MHSRDWNVAIGEFLRQRRSEFDPARLPIPTQGRRRVPGIRREEVAALANVSTSYYTRIERGVVSPSTSVLDAIADALQLDDSERAQLHRLDCTARVPDALTASHSVTTIRPELDLLLRQVPNSPAIAFGLDLRLLGWNRLGHAVFGGARSFDAPHTTDGGLNWARMLFVDDEFRSLFVEWEIVAVDVVGRLRVAHAQTCGARGIDDVVAQLRQESRDFDRIWQQHPAGERNAGPVHLRHPHLGDLLLHDTVLQMVDDESQQLRVYLADPGSTTGAALLRAGGRRLD